MRGMTVSALGLLAWFCTAASGLAQEYIGSVYFRPEASDLEDTPSQIAELQRVVARATAEPTRMVLLQGHTSYEQDAALARRVAASRLRDVWSALKEAGVPHERIVDQNAGEDKAQRSTPRVRSDLLDNRVDVFLSTRLHAAGDLPSEMDQTFSVWGGGRDRLPLDSVCPELVGHRLLHIDASEPDLVFRLSTPGHLDLHLDSPIEMTLVLRGPEGSVTCAVGRRGTYTSFPSLALGDYQLVVGRPDTGGDGREVGPFGLRVRRSAP